MRKKDTARPNSHYTLAKIEHFKIAKTSQKFEGSWAATIVFGTNFVCIHHIVQSVIQASSAAAV